MHATDALHTDEVTAAPSASPFGARAERWQERFYVPVKVAGCFAIAAFVFHVVNFHHTLHTLSLVCAWTGWSIFAAEVAVMLTVSRPPSGWARTHRLDIAVLAFACPLWPHVFSDLYLTELLPSFTLVDATLLAKLVKGVRVLRRHGAAAERRAGSAGSEPASQAVPAGGPPLVATAARAIATPNPARGAIVPVDAAAAPHPLGADRADAASGGPAQAAPAAPPRTTGGRPPEGA